MNYLAIDTCGKALTVVASFSGKTEYVYDPDCGVRHSADLMPAIETLTEKLGFDLGKADFIACVIGAGSFTGIRIGVSTAKALCYSKNLPCLALTSFDTLAYNKKGKVAAVINAGHGGYYVCLYNDFAAEKEPVFIKEEELADIAKDYELVSYEKIDGFAVSVVSAKDGLISAVKLNADKASFDLDKLTPLYLRKSQAEEGR